MSRFVYKVVKVKDSVDWPSKLQQQLDEHAEQGWRLAQTYLHDGYTVAFIFEREREMEPVNRDP